jgi:hypothetical protein
LLKQGVLRMCPDELCVELLKTKTPIQICLEQSINLMQNALNSQPVQSLTPYQIKARPLPQNIDDWIGFLSRNRMYRTAKICGRANDLPRSG